MSQKDRLGTGGRIHRGEPLTFTFNGREYQGYQGDTLASALLANGVRFVARSFKYHRPRGIVTADVAEPNAVVQLERGAHTVPNARATEIELYQGLVATSVNAEPDLERDRMAVNQKFARFMPAGFYYKTFMWPRKMWPTYEEKIREAAGLGKAPTEMDADRYDKCYAHCDVLVVGGGPAGLTAAHAAAVGGARVILVDDQRELGGSLLAGRSEINGKPALQWVGEIEGKLRKLPEVTILSRSNAFGYQDHNLVTVTQRLTDHLPVSKRRGTRELLWKIRAKRVILATGAHERPIVFGNNDLPGVMMASAVSTYIHRYGVLPGRDAVVFTNNDRGYQAALDLKANGAKVTVVDPRASTSGTLPALAKRQGVTVMNGAVVMAASGKRHVTSVNVTSYANGQSGSQMSKIPCDLVAMSGGLSPVLHLFAQSGGKAQWSDEKACFVPGKSLQAEVSVGAAAGEFNLAMALPLALEAGIDAAKRRIPSRNGPSRAEGHAHRRGCAAAALACRQPRGRRTRAEAVRRLPERRCRVGHPACRARRLRIGRTCEALHRDGLRYRPGQARQHQRDGDPGAGARQVDSRNRHDDVPPELYAGHVRHVRGPEVGDFLDPIRKTCIHEWHVEHGALFEDVGNWKRPWYFPKKGENLHAAVKRECLAVRNSVGILDASTLGKIDIQGPDAVTLLNWMYTNPWNKLEVGKCRYGLMLDENGMVFDDGVTVRLGEQHFMMTTTTGGAARVLTWLERWLQTEWPHMKVRLSSVTDHWATFAVVGPNSRKVLRKVCEDIDFANDAFPFMSYRNGTVAGAKARVMRISFSGELAYEVNVPANAGRAVWEALMAAGAEFDITPYGTETMHVLRAEKGYIIVGQDTDGSITPYDLGMGGVVAKSKDFLGKRSLTRSDTAKEDRKQFVGLLTDDADLVLPEGAQILAPGTRVSTTEPTPMIGHVTSSYYSPILKRSIALAVVKGGLGKMGQSVAIPLADGRRVMAKISSPVFYDTEGVRQNVE